MKVLRQGPEPKPVIKRIYRCTCDHCQSELEYDSDDLYIGPASGFWMIRCPVCRRGVFQNFVQRWWNRVRYRMPAVPPRF